LLADRHFGHDRSPIDLFHALVALKRNASGLHHAVDESPLGMIGVDILAVRSHARPAAAIALVAAAIALVAAAEFALALPLLALLPLKLFALLACLVLHFLGFGEAPSGPNVLVDKRKQARAAPGFDIHGIEHHRIDAQDGRLNDGRIKPSARDGICPGLDRKVTVLGGRLEFLNHVASRIIRVRRPVRIVHRAAGFRDHPAEIFRLAIIGQAGQLQRGVHKPQRNQRHQQHGHLLAMEQQQTFDAAQSLQIGFHCDTLPRLAEC
jgi:hypothetical protein